MFGFWWNNSSGDILSLFSLWCKNFRSIFRHSNISPKQMKSHHDSWNYHHEICKCQQQRFHWRLACVCHILLDIDFKIQEYTDHRSEKTLILNLWKLVGLKLIWTVHFSASSSSDPIFIMGAACDKNCSCGEDNKTVSSLNLGYCNYTPYVANCAWIWT